MEEKEYSNIYAIPANYTDSGKLMGGMVETRCAVEAIFLVGLVGYMTVTLLPLGVVALMGADGGSLLQYLWNIICFFTHRRKLHCRRVGYQYAQQTGKKRKKAKGKKAKA